MSEKNQRQVRWETSELQTKVHGQSCHAHHRMPVILQVKPWKCAKPLCFYNFLQVTEHAAPALAGLVQCFRYAGLRLGVMPVLHGCVQESISDAPIPAMWDCSGGLPNASCSLREEKLWAAETTEEVAEGGSSEQKRVRVVDERLLRE